MNRLPVRSPRHLSRQASRAGFTLAEVLLASVLGAMLLTALAVNTFGFTQNLDNLEEKAGVHENPDPDPVLRRMTKDVREAYWAEMAGVNDLKLASPTGDITEYWVESGKLWLRRPNGDTASILKDFQSLTIEPTYADRYREGPAANFDGLWHSTAAPSGSPIALQVPVGAKLALGFVAPAVPGDVPGQAASEEQVLSVQTAVIDIPIAWISGSGTKNLQMSLFESWAPGKGRPYQNALASTSIALSSLPDGHQEDGVWEVPSAISHLSLSAQLEPGVGYTLVLNATGNSKLLFQAVPLFPTTGHDEVSLQASGSSPWVAQPMVVPFDLKGPWTATNTVTTAVVTRVTITVFPSSRPLIQRSAALLSQTASDDPWLGVVPGEPAP